MLRREHRRMVQHMTVVVTVAALVLAGAVLGGCASSGKSVKPSKPTTTLNQAAKDKAAVEATIQGWYRDYFTAQQNPDQAHALLAKWAEPGYLAQAEAYVSQTAGRGLGVRRASPSRAAITIVSTVPETDGTYSVTTCDLNDNVLFDKASGAVANDAVGVYRSVWVVDRQPGGRWLIRSGQPAKVGTAYSPDWERQCAA